MAVVNINAALNRGNNMDRFSGSAPVAKSYTMGELELHTWFERDRALVELRVVATDETVFEVWDETVAELVEDGFLNPRDWKQSAYEYAQEIGAIA